MPDREMHISVDIETSGPQYNWYSLLSIGAIRVGTKQQFYIELQPDRDRVNPQSMRVNKLDFERLKREGIPPRDAMLKFREWIEWLQDFKVYRPVFVSYGTFDWAWVNEYFLRYLGANPFGLNSLDIESYFAGVVGRERITDSPIPRMFLRGLKHTHNALEDAKEQAEVFRRLQEHRRSLGSVL